VTRLVVAAHESQGVGLRVGDEAELGMCYPAGAAEHADAHLQPALGHQPRQHGQAVLLKGFDGGPEALQEERHQRGLVRAREQRIQVIGVQFLVHQEPRGRLGVGA